MTMMILDGTGSGGSRAKVGSDNRLHVDASSQPKVVHISHETGEAFLFAIGDFINITSLDTETGILYIKNTNSDKHLHIGTIRTCGTVPQKWRLREAPTAGTLISGATDANISSINMIKESEGSSGVTLYKGAEGITVSGGTVMDQWINGAGHSLEDFQGAFVIGPSQSIALSVEVASAGDVCCRVLAYLEDI